MKKNTKKMLISLVICTIAMTTITGIAPYTTKIYGNNKKIISTETAKLNNIKVSIDGNAPITMGAYNVNGSNYFRIRDICKPLNMNVASVSNGIMINPSESYNDSNNTPTAVQKTANVGIQQKIVTYGTTSNYASYFNIGGYNYFKLQDIVALSQSHLVTETDYAKTHGADPGFLPSPLPTIKTLKVDYDSSSDTIKLGTVKTDLQIIYQDAKNGTTTPQTVSSQQSVAPNETVQIDDYRMKLINLTNNERQSNGANGLQMNNDLMKIAQSRAEDMAALGYLPPGHIIPNVGSPDDSVKAYGYQETLAVAENAAMSTSDQAPDGVISIWRNSKPHNNNMLNSKWTHIGVGRAKNANGDYYYIQVFTEQ